MTKDKDWALLGTCKACGQELILTAADCWHPHSVERACPPEIDVGLGVNVPAWGGYGRPGPTYFIPNKEQPYA